MISRKSKFRFREKLWILQESLRSSINKKSGTTAFTSATIASFHSFVCVRITSVPSLTMICPVIWFFFTFSIWGHTMIYREVWLSCIETRKSLTQKNLILPCWAMYIVSDITRLTKYGRCNKLLGVNTGNKYIKQYWTRWNIVYCVQAIATNDLNQLTKMY